MSPGKASRNGATVFLWIVCTIAQITSAADVTNALLNGRETAKMVERLEQVHQNVDAASTIFESARRVPFFREKYKAAVKPRDKFATGSAYGLELLNNGQSLEAIEQFEALEQLATTSKTSADPKSLEQLRFYLALAHFRLGEQQNCLSNHNADSCLLPIRGAGFHINPAGSRKSIEILTNLLNLDPDNLSARWILNVASMTVGDYPEKVPAKWLIDPKVFESQYPLPRFTDVAAGIGLGGMTLAGGVVADDFDNDGFLDLLISEWSTHGQLHFYHNNGDGTFTDRTKEAGLIGLYGGLNMVQADYNNDGLVDVFILRGAWRREDGKHPNSLLKNKGNGTFEDVTESAGLLSFHPTQTAVWLDFNNDGLIDLFIGNESGPGVHPCELYRNNGDGTFTECARENGVDAVGFVKGVGSADYNGDGRPDLYLSILNGNNILFRNDGAASGGKEKTGRWKFTNVAKEAGVIEPLNSFPTWFCDYDNDGWPDLMVSGYHVVQGVGDVAADYLGLPHEAERARLFHNNKDGTFKDVTKEMGLYKVIHAMGANFGDLDNDGYPDFYFGTGDPALSMVIPNRMFRNDGGTNFQEVTTAGGFGHLQKGHAVAFADLDNDGDQDVFIVVGGAVSGDTFTDALFENPGNTNGWIYLQLEGKQSNRSAIGAKIKLSLEDDGKKREIYHTIGSGGSFGANPLRAEIGIGMASKVDIEITWPASGIKQQFLGVETRHLYQVKEDSDKIVLTPMKSFTFKKGADGHVHHQ
ncbi:MAG: repeat protein [Verrucomicrobiales bacterium]|jgi:hypothetical protein|nr:repeat protein [Verrucomicrobiales bacterium]